ncbi:HMG box-containing protein 4 isoform X1 [Diachasma alloeum]|uniref:HMG box-containing protein 4 isoform X1 n=2 Tax=Diachasma alloeum TaxID=454923 RepID=UPI00073848D6|nr:HMG box-containing protein 4 isoform X1 [Diachasma alloeum]
MLHSDVSKPKSEKTHQRRKPQNQLNRGMEMFASPKRPKQDELEVTGVSRSGRVRKKSSKLTDFESPDDLADSKLKRQQKAQQQLHAQQMLERFEAQQSQRQQSPAQPTTPAANRPRKNSGTHVSPQHPIKEEMPFDPPGEEPSSDSEDADDLNEDDKFSMESGSEEDMDPLMIDEKETGGFKRLEPPEQEASSQANSLYMLEKSKKKLIIKNGKIIGRMKAQRKDKGKTRFTAYMLWAKEVRQELLEQNSTMDFATISKRLGELWATVPNLEKYNWRKRAKRLASKPNAQAALKELATWKFSPPSSTRKKFINKAVNGKPQKSPSPKKTPQLSSPPRSVKSPDFSPSSRHGKDAHDLSIGPGTFKVAGTQPLDVAAHLKLLGESLTIIGERLKEHDGQIAVSGSLSVLLDSFLCALGPLMCLTQQIPEANGAEADTLSEVLDNIAYIMPGL